jgi:predicted membrane protein
VNNDMKARLTPQFVMGIAVIVFGLILTLDNLDLVDGRWFFRLWPLAVIGLGVSQITDQKPGPRVIFGYVWVGIGTLLLLRSLGIMHVHIGDFWPVIFIIIGGHLVWTATHRRRILPTDSLSTINAVAFMSGIQRRTNTSAFRGGELTAVMGGVEADLRHATISEDEAVVDVFAFWGGIKFKVPEQWTVVGKVVPLMGAYEDKTRPPKHETTKRLVIRGTAIMGGVEVVN